MCDRTNKNSCNAHYLCQSRSYIHTCRIGRGRNGASSRLESWRTPVGRRARTPLRAGSSLLAADKIIYTTTRSPKQKQIYTDSITASRREETCCMWHIQKKNGDCNVCLGTSQEDYQLNKSPKRPIFYKSGGEDNSYVSVINSMYY